MSTNLKKLFWTLFLAFSAHLLTAYFAWPWLFGSFKQTHDQLTHSDVVVLGDSSIKEHAPNDKDFASIAIRIERKLPPYRVSDLSSPANAMPVFESYVRYLSNQKTKPKYVVMDLNIRSFSPEVRFHPHYQFKNLKTQLDYGPFWYLALFRPYYIFSRALNTEKDEDFYRNLKIYDGDIEIGNAWDLEELVRRASTEDELRKWVSFTYKYKIPHDHLYLSQLSNINEMLKAANVLPVYYITPVDIDLLNKYSDHLVQGILDENISLVQKTLAKHSLSAINLAYALPSHSHFINHAPIEHYREAGRELVAEAVGSRIKEFEAEKSHYFSTSQTMRQLQ